jgi:hypothetical protein
MESVRIVNWTLSDGRPAVATITVTREKEENVFRTARETGEKQVLNQWLADCNDPKEECSTDICTIWAMPDGTKITTRTHTW